MEKCVSKVQFQQTYIVLCTNHRRYHILEGKSVYPPLLEKQNRFSLTRLIFKICRRLTRNELPLVKYYSHKECTALRNPDRGVGSRVCWGELLEVSPTSFSELKSSLLFLRCTLTRAPERWYGKGDLVTVGPCVFQRKKNVVIRSQTPATLIQQRWQRAHLDKMRVTSSSTLFFVR